MEQEESKVRVMSPDERNAYDGITIEEGGDSQESRYQRSYDGRGVGRGFQIHTFGWKDLLFGQKNMFQRVLMVVGIAAVLAFLFFVALPVIIVMLGVGVAVWLVLQLFLGK
ncbi:hypothetical protein SELR_08750 [Selenomonas ruminantium subsp. lactilytica TAM6421]|uniref:Uncharacterized protein n=1 Tax=Selenomonas ruminantium subsp. lactilytica (strain NBRC 103574 / TAM6421) TaxID=927704 RepID=I0GP96_SELRL|nr:hypothetical protein [Selenomonas ruminantium]BAL82583.1 hypothetical protein SELR_08750 [Selenomonas ruminantium subsp. lactilytica TAM6421]